MSSFLQQLGHFLSTPGKVFAHVRETVLPTPAPRKRVRDEQGEDPDQPPGNEERACIRSKLTDAHQPERKASRPCNGAAGPVPQLPPRSAARGADDADDAHTQPHPCQLQNPLYRSSLRSSGKPNLQAAYARGLRNLPLGEEANGNAAANRLATLFLDPVFGTAALRPGSAGLQAEDALAASPGGALLAAPRRHHGPQGGFRALQSPALWSRRALLRHEAAAAPEQVNWALLPFSDVYIAVGFDLLFVLRTASGTTSC